MVDFPWQTVQPRFKVGDPIHSECAGRVVDHGRIVEVDVAANTMKVHWDDGKAGEFITYPLDADYIEVEPGGKMPWES